MAVVVAEPRPPGEEMGPVPVVVAEPHHRRGPRQAARGVAVVDPVAVAVAVAVVPRTTAPPDQEVPVPVAAVLARAPARLARAPVVVAGRGGW